MTSDVVVRARAALEGVPELTVYADHVCARVDKCTCDGPFETYGHRPECGLVPIAQTSDQVVSFAAAARELVPELADEVERLTAALHQCQCWVGHGNCGGCSGYPGIVHEPACGFEWNQACPVHGVLAEELERLRAEAARAQSEGDWG